MALHGTYETLRDHVSRMDEGDLVGLRVATLLAAELAGGEAVDACGLLLEANRRYAGMER